MGRNMVLLKRKFLTTAIPSCIWFLNRNKSNPKHRERNGEVLFIDARKIGTPVKRSFEGVTRK